MAPVAVVTDTTHYLPAELVAAEELHLVSLYVRFGDDLERELDMPGYDAFYERLRSVKDVPSTSQPSIGDFLAVWQPLLDDGHDVLSVHLSGGLSGTVESARQAQAQRAERGLGERVAVLDSATACGGLGLVALAAARRARQGASLADAAAQGQAIRDELKMWFAVDTLEFLRRGGRIGAAQAWLGGALKVKPILAVESEITPVERVRTSGRAFERMVDFLRARAEDGCDAWAVQHIQAQEQVERLAERGREIFGCEPEFVSEIGPVIGTHVGPGLLGASGVHRRLLEP